MLDSEGRRRGADTTKRGSDVLRHHHDEGGDGVVRRSAVSFGGRSSSVEVGACASVKVKQWRSERRIRASEQKVILQRKLQAKVERTWRLQRQDAKCVGGETSGRRSRAKRIRCRKMRPRHIVAGESKPPLAISGRHRCTRASLNRGPLKRPAVFW